VRKESRRTGSRIEGGAEEGGDVPSRDRGIDADRGESCATKKAE